MYSAIYIFNLVIGMACILIAIFKIWCVINEILPERKHVANFVVPFILFYPNMFTDKGNKCRLRFFYLVRSLLPVL